MISSQLSLLILVNGKGVATLFKKYSGVSFVEAIKSRSLINSLPKTGVIPLCLDTNIKSLKINLESSKIKFKDRNPETGSNDYDTEKKIITVKVSNKGYYKFKINEENKNLCIYTELDKCIVEFHKK